MRDTQRRKRRYIIIFLFTVVIFMFAGFYYFSNDINIKGVGSSDGNFKVLITDVSLKEMTGLSSDKSKVPSFSDDKIEFYPFLNSPGESVTYTITVENQGALDAKYKFNSTLDDNNPGVKFRESFGEWKILNSGQSFEFDVTLYYDNAYAGKATGTISNLMLTLESIQNVNGVTDNSENKKVINNSQNITATPIMKVWHDNSSEDFHNDKYKSKISYVEFLNNTIIPSGAKSWDVSYNKDKSVIAYVLDDGAGGYKLYIGGYGGVISNNLSYLFYKFENLKSVNLSKLDTSNSISMKSAFEGCNSLTSLDLRTFSTQNVVVMNSMFKNCSSLNKVYASNNFITNQVISSKNMFLGCTSLVGQSGMKYNETATDKVSANFGTNGYFSAI